MESSDTSPNKAVIGIVVVALIAIAATGVIIVTSNKDTGSSTTDTMAAAGSNDTGSATSPSSTSTNSSVNSSTNFKDGTYTTNSSYDTPGGGASIGVTVTLSGNTITDVSLTQDAPDREAAEFQSRFASGYKSLVVGKKITDVSLTRVAGSSLTPIGFNNALQTIENQAKA